MKYEYVVSACLAGRRCKYNGGSNPCDQVVRLVKEGKALPVCPESLSGLPCPREPSERIGDKFFSKSGKDITEEFCKGTNQALKISLESGARKAIVKSRSPSCGFGSIYDGSFSGKVTSGNGIWTESLIRNGFVIFTEENLPDNL